MGEQLLGSPRPGHGRVFVVRDRRGEWWASWQDNYPDDEVGDGEPDAGVEDFEGTEEEVIRWARSRPAEEFFIFSPEAGDYIPLEPTQELPARRSTADVLKRLPRSAEQQAARSCSPNAAARSIRVAGNQAVTRRQPHEDSDFRPGKQQYPRPLCYATNPAWGSSN